MDRSTFGKRLEQIRLDKKLSQLKMANLCGLSSSHYSMIEAGTRNPNFDTMLRIAEGFRIPLSELLSDDNPPEYTNYDEATNNVIALMVALPTDVRKYAVKLVQAFSDSHK